MNEYLYYDLADIIEAYWIFITYLIIIITGVARLTFFPLASRASKNSV